MPQPPTIEPESHADAPQSPLNDLQSSSPLALENPVETPASTPNESRVAPLISAARFIPTAAPVSVLQAPTAPVDQPVRAAESMLSTESFVGTFAARSQSPSPGAAPSASPAQSLLNHAVASVSNVARNATQQTVMRQARSLPEPAEPPTVANAGAARTHAAAASPPAHAARPYAAAHAPAAHDPAALDALARQLYGRFSRHLAGELLIDRERSQFLTDLT
jgi:hypothetical protein